MQKFINNLYQILNWLLFVLLIISLYFTLSSIPMQEIFNFKGILSMLIALGLMLGIFWEIKTEKISLNIFFNTLIILLFINGYLLISCSISHPLYDSNILITGSNNDYFSYNANNILLRILFKFIEVINENLNLCFFKDHIKNFQFIYLLINIGNCYLIKHLATQLFNKKIGFISGIILMYYLLLQPIFMIPYSDIISLLLSLLTFNLLLKHDYKYFILAGIIAALNYLIRPSGIIFYIVIFLMIIINYIIKKDPNSLLQLKKITTSFLIFIISVVLINNLIYFIGNGKYDKNLKVPLTHFLSVGSYAENDNRNANHGTWNQYDYDITYSKRDKKEIIKDNLALFKKRILSRSLTENIRFYLYKLADVMDTGIMYYHRDGLWINYDEPDNQLGSEYKKLFNPNGEYKHMADMFYHTFWIAILIILILSGFFKNKTLLLLKLSLLGSLIFLIIFESGGTKYMIQYLFLIAIIGGYTLDKLINIWNEKRNNQLI